MPLKQARAIGTVVLERTVAELRGEPCIAFEDVEPQRKGMAVTRSSEPGSPALMAALDAVSTRYGKKSLVLAREGFAKRASMKQQFRSPRYTTRISDVPVIRG